MIEDVKVEHAPPQARRVLGDRTAFDAFIAYRTSSGEQGFLAIETKYTEPFSTPDYPGERYTTYTDIGGGWFRKGTAPTLRKTATNQLWRNLLLAQLAEANDGYGHGTAVVLSLAGDDHANQAVDGVRAALNDPARLAWATFEDVVRGALEEPDLRYWAHLFAARYLSPCD